MGQHRTQIRSLQSGLGGNATAWCGPAGQTAAEGSSCTRHMLRTHAREQLQCQVVNMDCSNTCLMGTPASPSTLRGSQRHCAMMASSPSSAPLLAKGCPSRPCCGKPQLYTSPPPRAVQWTDQGTCRQPAAPSENCTNLPGQCTTLLQGPHRSITDLLKSLGLSNMDFSTLGSVDTGSTCESNSVAPSAGDLHHIGQVRHFGRLRCGCYPRAQP